MHNLRKLIYSPNVSSGEEYDYVYVKKDNYYNFEAFNKKAMFVLPPRPDINFRIFFSDRLGSLKWFPVVVHRNGNRIMGYDEHMTCDVPYTIFSLRFIGNNVGWKVEDYQSL